MKAIFRIAVFIAVFVAMPFTVTFAQIIWHDTVEVEKYSYQWLDINSHSEIFFLSSAVYDSSMAVSDDYVQDSKGVLFLNVVGAGAYQYVEDVTPYFFRLAGNPSDITNDAYYFIVRVTNASYATAHVEYSQFGEGEGTVAHYCLEIEIPEKDRGKFQSLLDFTDLKNLVR